MEEARTPMAGQSHGTATDTDTASTSLRTLFRLYPWLGPVLTIGLGALGLTAFTEIASQVHRKGALLGLDERLFALATSARTDGLATIASIVTYLGESMIVVPIAVLAGIALAVWRRSWTPMILGAITPIGAAIAVFLVKMTIARPRPSEPIALMHESSFSFPSGHATQAAAVYAIFAVLIANYVARRWLRYTVVIVAPVFILLTGLSRVVLGVHSPLDVTAGWILGLSWVALVVGVWKLAPRVIAYLVRRKAAP